MLGTDDIQCARFAREHHAAVKLTKLKRSNTMRVTKPGEQSVIRCGTSIRADRKLALFQAVFDEIPDVVLLKDEDGNFLLCNQTVARLYGTTPDEMIGKHDDDFGVPTDMADGFRANVRAIMASGKTEIVFEDSRDATTG